MPGLSVCQTLFRQFFIFLRQHLLVNKKNILYNGFDFHIGKIHSESPSAEQLKSDRMSVFTHPQPRVAHLQPHFGGLQPQKNVF